MEVLWVLGWSRSRSTGSRMRATSPSESARTSQPWAAALMAPSVQVRLSSTTNRDLCVEPRRRSVSRGCAHDPRGCARAGPADPGGRGRPGCSLVSCYSQQESFNPNARASATSVKRDREGGPRASRAGIRGCVSGPTPRILEMRQRNFLKQCGL